MIAAPTFNISDTVERLRQSLATVEWAFEALPEGATHNLPPYLPADAWTAAMNVAHMVVYEEEIANPVLASLAAGGDGVGATRIRGTRVDDKVRQTPMEEWFLTEAQQLAVEPRSVLLDRLHMVRAEGVHLVESFSDGAFNAPVMPLWPPEMRSPGWLATKTFQHTWEHGNAVLRLVLFAPRS